MPIKVSTALQLFDDAGDAGVEVFDEPVSLAVLEKRARGYEAESKQGLVALPVAPEIQAQAK